MMFAYTRYLYNYSIENEYSYMNLSILYCIASCVGNIRLYGCIYAKYLKLQVI